MNLQPLEDRLIVEPKSEKETESGLIIPDTAEEKPQQGTVLEVGPGRHSEQTGEVIPMDIKKGDVIIFSKYGGTEINLGGKDVLILTSRDVLAIVK